MKNNKLKKLFALICAIIVGSSCLFGFGCGEQPEGPQTENHIKYLAADGDVAGREITSGQYKVDDYEVGIFYHIWHGDFGFDDGAQTPGTNLTGIHNIQYMQDTNDPALFDEDANLHQYHYWNEPLYGYYLPADKWVLTRHVELFTMADLDFICIDATNPHGNGRTARIFEKPVKALLDVLATYKAQGFDVPGVCFYTNSIAAVTVEALYETYYVPGLYDDLWYAPNGKPLIVGVTVNNSGGTDQQSYLPTVCTEDEEILEYFEFKDSKWPNTLDNPFDQTNAMPWMSWSCPQTIFSPSQFEERDGYVNVPVAQHEHTIGLTSVSVCAPESHRGYDNYTKQIAGDWKDGLSFQQMWDTVHDRSNQIKTVLTTGWNEWIAQKYVKSDFVNHPAGNTKGVHFVDVFNNEYSRDMEMMRAPGGYGDNYYLQLVYNIRKLKLTSLSNTSFAKNTIDINANDMSKEWEGIGVEYRDFAGDALERNSYDATGISIRYTDDSNRNDIVSIKVTNDDTYYYFYVETLASITPYESGTNWMNIFIGTEYGPSTFGGYDYVINREPNGNKTSVHQYSYSGWNKVATADLRVKDNTMMVRVPMHVFNRSATQTKIRFKVSDNVQNRFIDASTEHIMDYYVSGDSAPIGRLGFAYGN